MMDKAVDFNTSVTVPKDLFILDPTHQKIVTGKRDYRYLFEASGGHAIAVITFLCLVFAFITRTYDEIRVGTIPPLSRAFLIFIPILYTFWIILLLPSYLRFQQMRRTGYIIWGRAKSIRGEKVRWTGGSRGNIPIKSYEVTVHFQFINPHGRVISKHVTHLRKDLINKGTPKQGVVAILYVDDQNYLLL